MRWMIPVIATSTLRPWSAAASSRSPSPTAATARLWRKTFARNWNRNLAPSTNPGRHGWGACAMPFAMCCRALNGAKNCCTCLPCASRKSLQIKVFQMSESWEGRMDHLRKADLEQKLRRALREDQHEGLNMIGNADQLLHRLVGAVEDWISENTIGRAKSA